MDYEHTLTAADVKIRARDASSIAITVSAGWPQLPFIAEGRWSERGEDQGATETTEATEATATLATGRRVSSAAEVTIWDVAHYLTDVVGLVGGDQVRLGAVGAEEALVVFIDAEVAQRIHEAHEATSHAGPVIELVVTRRHPTGAEVAFTAFDLWLHSEDRDSEDGEDHDWGGEPDYDPSDADCEPGCSDCTDDSVPDFVDGRWYWDGNGPDGHDEDPYDYPCEGWCGAQPGQECSPACEPAQTDWSAPVRSLPPL